jgi:hypothetical protein
LYNGDALTPVFSWKKEAFSHHDLVKILQREHETERLCISPPVNIAHNVTFLIDNSKLKDQGDIKCDDMGSWKRTGTPKNKYRVKRNEDGSVKEITNVTESPSEDRELYTLRRTYYVNNSSNDVRKVICTLLGKLEKYKLGHSLVSIEFISQYKQI